jgi:hypothetical protein
MCLQGPRRPCTSAIELTTKDEHVHTISQIILAEVVELSKASPLADLGIQGSDLTGREFRLGSTDLRHLGACRQADLVSSSSASAIRLSAA